MCKMCDVLDDVICLAVVSQKKTQCVFGASVFVPKISTCRTRAVNGRRPKLMKNCRFLWKQIHNGWALASQPNPVPSDN